MTPTQRAISEQRIRDMQQDRDLLITGNVIGTIKNGKVSHCVHNRSSQNLVATVFSKNSPRMA